MEYLCCFHVIPSLVAFVIHLATTLHSGSRRRCCPCQNGDERQTDRQRIKSCNQKWQSIGSAMLFCYLCPRTVRRRRRRPRCCWESAAAVRQGFGKQLKKWLGKIPRIIIKMQTAIHGCHSGSGGAAGRQGTRTC